MRSEIRSKQFRYLLRVTLQIRDGSIGKIDYSVDSERKERGLLADEYPNAGNHIAIFECQLKQPPLLALENHTPKEFLWASRLNFKHWKLVDLDNYMGGNKHFTQIGGDNAMQ